MVRPRSVPGPSPVRPRSVPVRPGPPRSAPVRPGPSRSVSESRGTPSGLRSCVNDRLPTPLTTFSPRPLPASPRPRRPLTGPPFYYPVPPHGPRLAYFRANTVVGPRPSSPFSSPPLEALRGRSRGPPLSRPCPAVIVPEGPPDRFQTGSSTGPWLTSRVADSARNRPLFLRKRSPSHAHPMPLTSLLPLGRGPSQFSRRQYHYFLRDRVPQRPPPPPPPPPLPPPQPNKLRREGSCYKEKAARFDGSVSRGGKYLEGVRSGAGVAATVATAVEGALLIVPLHTMSSVAASRSFSSWSMDSCTLLTYETAHHTTTGGWGVAR